MFGYDSEVVSLRETGIGEGMWRPGVPQVAGLWAVNPGLFTGRRLRRREGRSGLGHRGWGADVDVDGECAAWLGARAAAVAWHGWILVVFVL